MRVNPITPEAVQPENLTLDELHAVLPGIVQKVVRKQLTERHRVIAARERAVAMHGLDRGTVGRARHECRWLLGS